MAQEEKLYNTILSREMTWEGLIRDIVQTEGLDPWDIDISKLTKKYFNALREMKETDIRISGKFILAAAILLKMKSDYLIVKEEEKLEEKKEEVFYESKNYELSPNIPMPKERKVTITELISSLQKALDVNKRRKIKRERRDVQVNVELKKIDLGEKVSELYKKIVGFFQRFKQGKLTFSTLVPSEEKEDVIWTFIPLIHLANRGKIDLEQKEEFGEIYVRKQK